MSREQHLAVPQLDAAVFAQMQALLAVIEDKLARRENARAEIDQFHRLAKRKHYYTVYDFVSYSGSRSAESFITEILLPDAPVLANLTQAEVIILLRHITNHTLLPEYRDHFYTVLSRSSQYAYSIEQVTDRLLADPEDPEKISYEQAAELILNNQPAGPQNGKLPNVIYL